MLSPRTSSPRAWALRANFCGSPLKLYSITGPNRRAVKAPWGTSWTPPADYVEPNVSSKVVKIVLGYEWREE